MERKLDQLKEQALLVVILGTATLLACFCILAAAIV
jgi:hypothetical protein